MEHILFNRTENVRDANPFMGKQICIKLLASELFALLY